MEEQIQLPKDGSMQVKIQLAALEEADRLYLFSFCLVLLLYFHVHSGYQETY